MDSIQNEGNILEGEFEVSRVVGWNHDGRQLWIQFAGQFPETCGIESCQNTAEVGGYMWVKRRRTFCFILPICQFHNGDQNLEYPRYRWTKTNVRLVARNTEDGMYVYEQPWWRRCSMM